MEVKCGWKNNPASHEAGLAALLLLFFVAFTQVVEGESAIMLRFGKPTRVLKDPGLHFKWPWPVEEAAVIDMRRHNFHTRHTEMLTADKKNIILLSFHLVCRRPTVVSSICWVCCDC